ncbi:MAG: glycosyltransferase [Ktedonobacterales bacterium]
MELQESTPAMRRVAVSDKTLADYAPVAGEDIIGEIEALAAPLRGAHVVHVSATAQGGGVVELLSTLIPLMRSVGLDTEWRVIAGSEPFFQVTKSLHNGLQGMPLELSPQMKQTFLEENAYNASAFDTGYDFVVVHDPQPVPLRTLRPHDSGTWIWRCHIDLTAANPVIWDYFRPFIQVYDAAVFSMPAFARADLLISHKAIIPPAIDPLSPKNAPQGELESYRLIQRSGVDPARPLLVQVSRFDPWKDPLGVVDVYRGLRRQISGIQLVLLGALADDDPEGDEYYQRTREYAGNDPDIHVLLNTGGPLEVNAFQRLAAVVLQKSLREGFGLTVTEAMWKERPVIGGNVGGIPLQIQDGVSGYLVSSVEQCIGRAADVLRGPVAAREMGRRGRETVRRAFLSTANLRNYLALFQKLRTSR